MIAPISFVDVGTDLHNFRVAPAVVVTMHERLDGGFEFGEGGEGVPVVVLVLEDAPEILCNRVVVTPRRQPTAGFALAGWRCLRRSISVLVRPRWTCSLERVRTDRCDDLQPRPD